MQLVLKCTSGSIIVYTLSRNDADAIASHLRSAGVSALSYHSHVHTEERAHRQRQWSSGQVNVMCATSAFEVGINNAHVRFVILFTMPSAVHAIWQRWGRAGRDNEPAKRILFFAASEERVWTSMLNKECRRIIRAEADDSAAALTRVRQIQQRLDLAGSFCRELKRCRHLLVMDAGWNLPVLIHDSLDS